MVKEQTGTVQAEATEIETSGEKITGKHLIADGGDGKEKEVTERDPVAGAGSTATASSGIPSAMKQQGIVAGETQDQMTASQTDTPMGDRKIAHHQDTQP